MENMTENAKKLLEGLTADNVEITVHSLAEYMSSNGVRVKPHIKRTRAYIPMPSSVYGIDLSTFSEQGGAFYKSRVSQSHLTFIPPEDDLELNALEKRLRRAVESRCVSEDFMPMRSYDALKEDFQKIRDAYFEKMEEIIQNWAFLSANFKVGVEEMLKGITVLTDDRREQLLKAFLSQIPSPDEYRASFAMNLSVHAFPAESSAVPEGLDSSIAGDVKATWSEEVVRTAILSIEKTVGDGWSRMIGAMRQYLNGASIRQSSIDNLLKFARSLEMKNVFKNPLLSYMGKELKTLSSKDGGTQAEIIENTIAYTYAYAKENGIDLNMDKSPYSISELDSMGYFAVAQMRLEG